MSVLLVNYPGVDSLDVLSFSEIGDAIGEDLKPPKRFFPKLLTLPICRRARSEAYCRVVDHLTIEIVWDENNLNTKNEVDKGSLFLQWKRQEDVFTTVPETIRWEGLDGYIVYPVATLVRGNIVLDTGK
jgi:hypothetical protein